MMIIPLGRLLSTNSWVPQTFPARTEGSVKKHWYKVGNCWESLKHLPLADILTQDMHYAEFAEDEVRPIMTHLHHMLFLTLPAN